MIVGGSQGRRRRAPCPPRRCLARCSPAMCILIITFLVSSLTSVSGSAEIEIHTKEYSYSRGVKKDVTIAIEATEIKGSEVRGVHSSSTHTKTNAKPSPSTTTIKPPSSSSSSSSSSSPSTTPSSSATRKPPSSSSSSPSPSTATTTKPSSSIPTTTTTKQPTPMAKPPTDRKPAAEKQSPSTHLSSLWPYELGEELTQQELMTILVIIVSSVGLLALFSVALWSIVQFTWLHLHERRLLATLFGPRINADDLEKAITTHTVSMPVLMRPLATAHLRLVRTNAMADKLLASTANVSFNEDSLEIAGLPHTEDKTTIMTFFQLLGTIESLQCQGDSITVELATLAVPVRWSRSIDFKNSVAQLQSRMVALRQRHETITQTQVAIVRVLEQRHLDGKAIGERELNALMAALRQPAPQSHGETSQLSSPLKMKSPRDGKDEFAFFLRSFEEINQQRQMQRGLEEVFASVNVTMETRVASPTHSDRDERGTQSDAKQTAITTTTTTRTARMDSTWTRTLETMVDRADELEMTYLEEVKRAQYMLEESKRESFCLLNSSHDAMQSVESLKASLVALGADPKAAVLTAAEIYSTRSNMLMLTTTLRSVFDEFRKGDLIKMEERRRRHALKEKEKRERIMAKFHMKQHLMVEKMENQRALEREKQQRQREQREKEEYDALVKQTKLERRQFVQMITKLDVLIVLLVLGIVFFDNLSRQLDMLKPQCVREPASSHSMLGFASSSWWPASSLSLLQCRLEYIVKVGGLLLLSIAVYFVVAYLNLLTTALPVALAAGLYHVRSDWMNMLFRLPVLLVLYGFNSMVLYLVNRSLVSAETSQRKAKRRAVLFHVGFPLASVVLSVVVSIIIACDNPKSCVVMALGVTQRTFATLGQIARHAYHLS